MSIKMTMSLSKVTSVLGEIKNLEANRCHSDGEIMIIGKNVNKNDNVPVKSDICTLLEKKDQIFYMVQKHFLKKALKNANFPRTS